VPGQRRSYTPPPQRYRGSRVRSSWKARYTAICPN
jgi:hypothetical protein